MYVLFVEINTDDDAMIFFEGKQYCFYGEDLRICRPFHTVNECYEFLRNEIIIEPGWKASEALREWIEDFIETHKRGEAWMGIHGNQEVDISIRQCNPPEDTPTRTPLRIVRAAIKDDRGAIWSVPAPGRHHDVINLMRKSGYEGPVGGDHQGFLTSEGGFVRRAPAKKIAEKANQIKGGKTISATLTSEDLW